jgi:hypothetical protein
MLERLFLPRKIKWIKFRNGNDEIKKANPIKTGSAFRFNQTSTSTARQIAPFYRRAINPPACGTSPALLRP